MRTRHVLAAAAALALAGTAAGAALTGATAAPATGPQGRPDRHHHRQEARRPAQRRPGARRHPLLGRQLRRPALQAGARGGGRRSSSRAKKAPAEGVSADGGLLRFTTGSATTRPAGLDPRPHRRAPADRRHLQVREVREPRREDRLRLPQHAGSRASRSCRSSSRRAYTRRQGDPPLRDRDRQRHHLRRRRRRQRGPRDLGPPARSPRSPRSSRPRSRSPRAGAEANGLPSCTVGKQVRVRGGPDRHRGRPRRQALRHQPPGRSGGRPASAPTAGCCKVNPTTGKVKTLAGGLSAPTGVAVASNGDIYVAQLFLGVISRSRPARRRSSPTSSAAARRGRGDPDRAPRDDQRPARQEAQGPGRHDHPVT